MSLTVLVLVICCLRTVESGQCNNTEIIIGQLEKELVFDFQLSDIRDEYNKYIHEYNKYISKRDGKKIIQDETQIKDLVKEADIRFEIKIDSRIEQIIFINGNPTDSSVDSRTKINMTNNAFVVKITKLQKEDAGIYWIEFRSIRLGQKAVIILGKPTIQSWYPPNPVLIADDNHGTTLQLECHSNSTSIGDCITMYTVWYKNETRITDVDPTLSQINVNVDRNGGNFTCLATDYPPCYQRLQTTKHYDVLNIEECNNVSESETFSLKTKYKPIDVKLEPDQREITVIKGDDLKVRCSAKCHPKCEIKWKKHFQGLKSGGLIIITENTFENDLVIENVNSSHEGVYVCLVNKENKKNFTLSVTETINQERNNVFVAVSVVIVIVVTVIVVVIMVIRYKKYHKKGNDQYGLVPRGNSPRDDEGFHESGLDLQNQVLPETSTDNNSRNGEQNMNFTNNLLEFNNSVGNSINRNNPNPADWKTRPSKKQRRYSNVWIWIQRKFG